MFTYASARRCTRSFGCAFGDSQSDSFCCYSPVPKTLYCITVQYSTSNHTTTHRIRKELHRASPRLAVIHAALFCCCGLLPVCSPVHCKSARHVTSCCRPVSHVPCPVSHPVRPVPSNPVPSRPLVNAMCQLPNTYSITVYSYVFAMTLEHSPFVSCQDDVMSCRAVYSYSYSYSYHMICGPASRGVRRVLCSVPVLLVHPVPFVSTRFDSTRRDTTRRDTIRRDHSFIRFALALALVELCSALLPIELSRSLAELVVC